MSSPVRRHRRGMTLVEVMVVVAIVLTLLAVLGAGVVQAYQRMQVQTSKLAIQRTSQDLLGYELTEGHLPTQSEGLEAVYGAEGVPRDAWGTELAYVERPTDIISYGADKQPGGDGFSADLHRE